MGDTAKRRRFVDFSGLRALAPDACSASASAANSRSHPVCNCHAVPDVDKRLPGPALSEGLGGAHAHDNRTIQHRSTSPVREPSAGETGIQPPVCQCSWLDLAVHLRSSYPSTHTPGRSSSSASLWLRLRCLLAAHQAAAAPHLLTYGH